MSRSEPRLSRRGLLGLGAVGGVALAGGVAGGLAVAGTSTASAATAAAEPFLGRHQAGIATAVQDRLVFASFDVTSTDRAALARMLRSWSAAAEAMTQGEPVPGPSGGLLAPPADTGEAIGLAPARLTVTVGFGPSLFDARFGLRSRRPALLAPLPALPGELLEDARSGGDISVQAAANDPQVAFHAVRNLARLGRGIVVMRWSQLGFGRTSSTSETQETARNLMGFKDGTRNVLAEDGEAMAKHVWVGSETDQEWMRDGSYQVTRRIRMLIESWDRASLGEQEQTIGRFKGSGAPLTGTQEHDAPDFTAAVAGQPQIRADAHVRLAAPETNHGVQILRRGYSYTDGMDAKTGQLDAGLFFISYQKDPGQFVALQRRLGAHDALNEYIKHTGSGLFACPPGLAAGGSWADPLFG